MIQYVVNIRNLDWMLHVNDKMIFSTGWQQHQKPTHPFLKSIFFPVSWFVFLFHLHSLTHSSLYPAVLLSSVCILSLFPARRSCFSSRGLMMVFRTLSIAAVLHNCQQIKWEFQAVLQTAHPRDNRQLLEARRPTHTLPLTCCMSVYVK